MQEPQAEAILYAAKRQLPAGKISLVSGVLMVTHVEINNGKRASRFICRQLQAAFPALHGYVAFIFIAIFAGEFSTPDQ